VPKDIRPAPGAADEPGALTVVEAGDDAAQRTVTRVAQVLVDGAQASEVAVLARVNASLAPVQVLLRHQGVPVRGGVDARFLNRGGVRAAIAWLEVAGAPEKALPGPALREAARRPKRGLGDRLLGWIAEQRSVDGLHRLSSRLQTDREADKVLDLANDVAKVRAAAESGDTAAVLAVVRHEVGSGGLDASAAALDRWSHGNVSSHADDLDALAALAHLEPDPARFEAWLRDSLSMADDEHGVTLASIHAVKGQEWPHVVVHHVTAGLLPHHLVVDAEEERRVLHVGITRGRSSVTVVAGNPPSPFLAELAEPGEPPPLRAAPALVTSKSAPTSGSADGPPLTPEQEAVFERLRTWRTDKAKAAGKPAYTVFADATLRDLARRMPTDESGLRRVHGVGPAKLDAYGDELLKLLAELQP
jgi:DNA helicase-2/ATP-dependent DNA helicase PcrA